MADYTPGPWIRRDYTLFGALGTGKDGKGRRTIGTVHQCASPEGDANGTLMEAAPDLLRACVALRILVDEIVRGKFLTRTEFMAAVEFADAALARVGDAPPTEGDPQKGAFLDGRA